MPKLAVQRPDVRSLALVAAPASATVPCRAGDADLWFAESAEQLELAKQLCRPCAVRADCLSGALVRHEPWGVWGGELFDNGAVIERKRPRGRPRKPREHDAA